jgi:cytochrome c
LEKNQQQTSNIITAETIPAPLATAMNGEEVYNSACLVCHTTGAGGAPLIGDSATWEVRMEQGIETLMEHAIEGYMGDGGIMPAKGGRFDLSDQEVENAVVYMLEQF